MNLKCTGTLRTTFNISSRKRFGSCAKAIYPKYNGEIYIAHALDAKFIPKRFQQFMFIARKISSIYLTKYAIKSNLLKARQRKISRGMTAVASGPAQDIGQLN